MADYFPFSMQETFSTGSNLDIDTGAEQLIATSHVAKEGVLLKADAANAGIIYVGSSSAVTAGSAAATDGFPLSAGDGLVLGVSNANKVYAVASEANQKLFFLVV